MSEREHLKNKLRAKINQRRMQSGRQPENDNTQKLTTKEEILGTAISMIQDCQLPYIKRLNVRQKFDVLEKKYRNLKMQYIPIFRSILNEELTMENIGMLEMMLNMRNTATDDQMNNFLAEKYKLDQNEASKTDNINTETAQQQFHDYLQNNNNNEYDDETNKETKDD